MRRLDFERTPLRNPFNKETPGRILYRKWSNSVAFEGGWWRAYGLSVACIACFVLLVGWIIYRNQSGFGIDYWTMLGLSFLSILYLITRYQLCALPALTLVKASKESLWVHFRMTLAGGHTAAFAMFWFAFDRCVIPLVVISIPLVFVRVFMNYSLAGIHLNVITYIILVPVILLLFGLTGILLSGLGFIGVMIRRSVGAVLIAVIAPLIISLFMGGTVFIGNLMEMLKTFTPGNIGSSPGSIIIAPENIILSSLTQLDTASMIPPILISWPPIIHVITSLAVLSAIIWLGLWTWLRISLPDPHLEKQI
ncbi:MAG: hypothetical protein NTY09_15100 [bacterium]|nr:hypothetical protein [bacterium]